MHVSRASSDVVVRLEDYTPSEEIGLLDEGIDRYLSISPHKGLVELHGREIRDDWFQRLPQSLQLYIAGNTSIMCGIVYSIACSPNLAFFCGNGGFSCHESRDEKDCQRRFSRAIGAG